MQELKVGDWVYYEGKDLFCLTQNDLDYLVGCDLKLWKPAEGNWCWFWNPGTKLPPILAKFTVMYRECYGSTKNASGEHSFYKCEPYLGELPSRLKDR